MAFFLISFGTVAMAIAFWLFLNKDVNFLHSNRLLGFFLALCAGLLYLNSWTFGSSFSLHFLLFYKNGTLFFLCMAVPMFYFFVRSITIKVGISEGKDLCHFFPSLILLIALLFYSLEVDSDPMAFTLKLNANSNIFISWFEKLLAIFMFSYLIAMTRLIRGSRVISNRSRQWLIRFTSGLFLYILWHYVFYFFLDRSHLSIYVGIGSVFLGLIIIFMYWAFVVDSYSFEKNTSNIDMILKYKKTGLSKVITSELKIKLVQYMENEKPFLNQELRMLDIANQLGISAHHTSQLINEGFSMNYSDFINSYRLKEAVKILGDTSKQRVNMNISEVAFNSGFNTRASFYNAFKKTFKTTPREFIEKSFVHY